MPSILDRLNDRQREAAGHGDGPLLVIAGAGSGKTRTLTHRIAYLIGERDVAPRAILAVTFTNKAAAEMKERVVALVGDAARAMWIGTFHSLCARLLREHAAKVGLTSHFAIFDQDDQTALLRRILKSLDIDAKQHPPAQLSWRISDWKNDLLLPDAVAAQLGEGALPPDKLALRVYEQYQRELRRHNAVDFDDLILLAVRLLKTDDAVRRGLSQRFRQVLVDEYQDINQAQYELVRLFASEHDNLCVVGDDDQSIYGWRGARLEIILRFDEDFPGAKVVKLEQNYRSTPAVLDVANAVIANNRGRRPKALHSTKARGESVILHVAGNEHDEAWFVADQIQHAVRSGERAYRDHAVLYRTNAMSRVFEQVFATSQVPYRMIGGVRFYERKEIRDVIAYLRVLLNPADDVSLTRIINVPARGIGDKTIDLLRGHAAEHGQSMYDAIPGAASETELLPARSRGQLAGFHTVMEGLRAGLDRGTVAELIGAVLRETGYEAALTADHGIEAAARLENLSELGSVAVEATEETGAAGLTAFLEQVALVSDTDALDASADAVVLMTLHSAKGLEFPVVFLVGVEEEILPHLRSKEQGREGIEEERRLCYVGMTRAAERLYLTHTWRRTVFGTTRMSRRSRFLDEIPAELLQGEGLLPQTTASESTPALVDLTAVLSRHRRATPRAEPAGSPAAGSPAAYKAGQKVRHATFGEGIVVNCTGGPSAEVQVAFPDKGVKRLAVEYARLEPI